MASIAISASLQRACSSRHVTKKQQSTPAARTARSLGSKQATHVVTLNVEGQKGLGIADQPQKSAIDIDGRKDSGNVASEHGLEGEPSALIFTDERWKKGTWDLNMFVKDGRMNWDGPIIAAQRRRFLELYPAVSTNEEPVLFRSSIIAWWAWLKRSYLPEAELLNGRAAMVGFYMAYMVDALTGLDTVGQTGNVICKAGVFVTVRGVILLRRTGDFENLKKLANGATFYDKQWQASWQDQGAATTASSSKKAGN